MQAAGDLVHPLVELSARMELSHHDFGRRDLLCGMHFRGNPAAVVNNRDRSVHVDGEGDLVAIPRHGFIDAVVNNLVNQVMKPAMSGGPDIHRGSFAHTLESFENPNLLCAVPFCHPLLP